MTYQHQRKDIEGHSITIYFRMCVVCVFFLMQACSAVSQPKIDLIPYRIDSLWGFSNVEGKIVIPVEYDAVCFFSNGVARVFKDDKWGLIDTIGNIVAPIQFESDNVEFPLRVEDGTLMLSNVYTTLPIPTKENGKYGYIDENGEWLVPPQFEVAHLFNGDHAVVKYEDKYGLIDKKGSFVIDPEYDIMGDYGGSFRVVRNDSVGVVDKKNNVIIPLRDHGVWGWMEVFKVTDRDNTGEYKHGVYDKGGLVVPIKYSYLEVASYSPLLFTFSEDSENWGLIDSTGAVVMEPRYRGNLMATIEGIHFRNGVASLFSVDSSVVKEMEEKEMKGDTTGLKEYIETIGVYEYINTNLETTFSVKCNLCFLLPFSGETYTVMGWFTDGEDVRLYNKKGERIENYIGKMVDNRAMVVDLEKGKVGFVNEKGKQAIPMKYSIPMLMEDLDDQLRLNPLDFSDFSSTTGLAKVYVDRKRYGFISTDGFEYFQFTDR